jgi:hypothetical protein
MGGRRLAVVRAGRNNGSTGVGLVDLHLEDLGLDLQLRGVDFTGDRTCGRSVDLQSVPREHQWHNHGNSKIIANGMVSANGNNSVNGRIMPRFVRVHTYLGNFPI